MLYTASTLYMLGLINVTFGSEAVKGEGVSLLVSQVTFAARSTATDPPGECEEEEGKPDGRRGPGVTNHVEMRTEWKRHQKQGQEGSVGTTT